MMQSLFIFTLLGSSVSSTIRLISNKTFYIEEYETAKFDCQIDRYVLFAWRIQFRSDDTFRYYYINSIYRNQFLHTNETESKSRDIQFENHHQLLFIVHTKQWMNNVFQCIECLLFNNQTNNLVKMIFYLNIYVSPSSFLLNINHTNLEANQLIYWFDGNYQRLDVSCEISSYPKSTLIFIQNSNQILMFNETIDCLHDNQHYFLSNRFCLQQTHWQQRVRITTNILVTDQLNLTCAVTHFPYGNLWKSSRHIQFLQHKEKSIKLSTSSDTDSRITTQIVTHSVYPQISDNKRTETFIGGKYHLLVLILLTILIVFGYFIWKIKFC